MSPWTLHFQNSHCSGSLCKNLLDSIDLSYNSATQLGYFPTGFSPCAHDRPNLGLVTSIPNSHVMLFSLIPWGFYILPHVQKPMKRTNDCLAGTVLKNSILPFPPLPPPLMTLCKLLRLTNSKLHAEPQCKISHSNLTLAAEKLKGGNASKTYAWVTLTWENKELGPSSKYRYPCPWATTLWHKPLHKMKVPISSCSP